MFSATEKRFRHYQYVPGFGDFADFITSDEDHSSAIYRRFDKLASRDLLYYQSELARLETCQDEFDIEDRKEVEQQTASWRDIRKTACDWDDLRSSNRSPQNTLKERRRKRMELAMEIRRTLKDYRETLIQESMLLSFNHPSKQTMQAVSNYFHQPVNDDAYSYSTLPLLSGTSSGLYPRKMQAPQIEASDYVMLRSGDESDLLTRFLKTYCSRLFRIDRGSLLPQYPRDTISHLPKDQVKHYSIQRVQLAASFISTVTASVLLIAPIYTLYHTAQSNPVLSLGLIVLYTFVFAGAIVITTHARRAEIFGACAAYAAVLVVFVSGNFVGGLGTS